MEHEIDDIVPVVSALRMHSPVFALKVLYEPSVEPVYKCLPSNAILDTCRLCLTSKVLAFVNVTALSAPNSNFIAFILFVKHVK
jgi:hypothetical protein